MTIDEVREQVEYLESTGIFKFNSIASHSFGYPVYDVMNGVELIYLPRLDRYFFVKVGTSVQIPFEEILQSVSADVQIKLLFHLDLFR